MMACGLPVIDLLGENTSAEFPEGSITLGDPDPHPLADEIERLLADPGCGGGRRTGALRYVQGLSWEQAGRQVEAALCAGILTRADGEASRGEAGGNGRLGPVGGSGIGSLRPSRPAEDEPAVTCRGPIVFVGQPEYRPLGVLRPDLDRRALRVSGHQCRLVRNRRAVPPGARVGRPHGRRLPARVVRPAPRRVRGSQGRRRDDDRVLVRIRSPRAVAAPTPTSSSASTR